MFLVRFWPSTLWRIGCGRFSELDSWLFFLPCTDLTIVTKNARVKGSSYWYLVFARTHLSGGFNEAPPRLPRMKNKSTKTWSAWRGEVADLSKEKGPAPFHSGAFIRFIRIGIQIKLISHCQPVRVKQYMIYRELWGLILSYSQLVRGP